MHKRTLSQSFKMATWNHYLKTVPVAKRERIAKRQNAVRDYLEDGTSFAIDIAKKHQVSPETLRTWVKEYVSFG